MIFAPCRKNVQVSSLFKLSFFVLAWSLSTGCRAPPALSTNKSAFAAASISMQQFHQTRFVRKTFCQRLIERCQTDEDETKLAVPLQAVINNRL